jgi:hypothetical protein
MDQSKADSGRIDLSRVADLGVIRERLPTPAGGLMSGENMKLLAVAEKAWTDRMRLGWS